MQGWSTEQQGSDALRISSEKQCQQRPGFEQIGMDTSSDGKERLRRELLCKGIEAPCNGMAMRGHGFGERGTERIGTDQPRGARRGKIKKQKKETEKL